MSGFPVLTVALPAWIDEVCRPGQTLATLEEQMDLAIGLSRHNTAAGTGGPFGAVVVDREGRVVAVGVNLVVPARAAILHAETVALALAGQAVGDFRLPGHDLVSSTEPCAMCLGALPWAGVDRLVCGARHEDAAAAGFDEGDKPADWVAGLARRGIETIRDVRRRQASQVLIDYVQSGGIVYNGRPGQA
jgi:tRNA(Arg) A34 adenosine deaminase TadA